MQNIFAFLWINYIHKMHIYDVFIKIAALEEQLQKEKEKASYEKDLLVSNYLHVY